MSKRKIRLSEETLIGALREKNGMGLHALYDMYSASLFGIISRIVPDASLAEDVLQETFVRIWSNFEKYDPQKGRLFTWMARLSRHLAIDSIRSKNYLQSALQVEPPESAPEIIVPEADYQAMEYRTVLSFIQRLIPRERQVLELIYFKGFKHTEVAAALNMPLGSVKTCCRAGTQKLRLRFASDLSQLDRPC